MRNTYLKRKSSTYIKFWSGDYLVVSALQRDLVSNCALLTGNLLDLGCGNSPYREWLVNIQSYVAYDVDVLGGLPEVVGISETLPFKSDSFDSILCTQVLEHVPRPWLTMAEIFRVLKPNGRLLLSVPQSWRLHEQPHDFYRYTRFGLQSLCDQANLSIEKILPQGGAWALIGQNINNTIWRSSIKKFTVSWYFRVVISILSNTIFGSLDKLDQDTDDTLNYVVLARKLV